MRRRAGLRPAYLVMVYAWLIVLAGVIAFSACGSETPAAPPAPSPTATPLPATETAAPSATATIPPATATSEPTATPRPTTAAPPPSGFPAEVVRGDATKPMVAITFDSGAASGETGKILDILARNQVRSSWFITGQFAERYSALVRRVAQEGHEVFNHSYSHPDLTTLTDADIIAEMNKAEEVLRGMSGKTTKPYMRMPFGARNPRVLKVVGDLGYRSIYWTLDAADWREDWTAPMVEERVLANTGNGYIIVHHSSPVATSGALENEIRTLKQRGFQLVTVTTLLSQQGGSSIQSTTPDQAPDGDDLLALVNKQIRLPDGYQPADLRDLTPEGVTTLYRGLQLRAVAVTGLARLVAAAKADGLDPVVLSAYRSYQEQQSVYQREVAAQGQAQAERLVALPGHSQHQLGTTVDFTAKSVNLDLSEAFGETAEGRWLLANAHRFGFVLGYPKGKESITGYEYEPWHYRYIGESAAADLLRRGITLEEYLATRR